MNIFSQSVLPFHCFDSGLWKAVFLIFYEVIWSTFSFMVCASLCKKSLPTPSSWRFSPVFPFRNFITLSFWCKSMMCQHLWIWCQAEAEVIFFLVGIYGSSTTICWKDCLLYIELPWLCDHICAILFLGSICYIDLSLPWGHTVGWLLFSVIFLKL